MRKLAALDGLRGFAILMVIWHHLPHVEGWSFINRIPSLLRLGYLGVDIFFVLSGFLITRILIAEKKQNSFSFRKFYTKRALRIFPAYYLLILFIGIVYTWEGMLPNALYYSNFYYSFHTEPHPLRHSWSLSVEEHFYLVWPLIFYYFTLSRSETIIKYIFPAVAIASAIVTVALIDNTTAAALIYRATPYRILSLSLGALLAFKEDKIPAIKPVYLIGCAAGLLILNYVLERPGTMKPLLDLLLLTPVSVLVFLLARSMEYQNNGLRIFFINPVITYIGKISYGLYLYHFPVLFYFGITYNQIQHTHVSWTAIILPLALIFATATISWFFIERYFLRLKGKLEPVKKSEVPIRQGEDLSSIHQSL